MKEQVIDIFLIPIEVYVIVILLGILGSLIRYLYVFLRVRECDWIVFVYEVFLIGLFVSFVTFWITLYLSKGEFAVAIVSSSLSAFTGLDILIPFKERISKLFAKFGPKDLLS